VGMDERKPRHLDEVALKTAELVLSDRRGDVARAGRAFGLGVDCGVGRESLDNLDEARHRAEKRVLKLWVFVALTKLHQGVADWFV
jgi:hypothetical protein